jgi:hypothetical protein
MHTDGETRQICNYAALDGERARAVLSLSVLSLAPAASRVRGTVIAIIIVVAAPALGVDRLSICCHPAKFLISIAIIKHEVILSGAAAALLGNPFSLSLACTHCQQPNAPPDANPTLIAISRTTFPFIDHAN